MLASVGFIATAFQHVCLDDANAFEGQMGVAQAANRLLAELERATTAPMVDAVVESREAHEADTLG
jgi:hypothetical protein